MKMSDPHSKSFQSHQQLIKMQNLLEEITEIHKSNQNTDKNIRRVQEIITESSQIVEDSTLPNEIVVDAKIFDVGSNYFSSNVSSLNTNLTSFNEEKYIDGILNYIEQEHEVVSSGREWDALAPLTYHLFKKSDPTTFMLGPLNLKPLDETNSQVRKEKQKSEKSKKVVDDNRTVLTSIVNDEKHEEEGSDIYEHILKSLVQKFKENNKKPLNYFTFIINPTDYWKTIENIFHFAFLVRDGSIKMSLENDLPFIQPFLKNSDDRSASQLNNFQFCLTMSISDWEKLIERFQISCPSIPPFQKEN